MRLVIAITACMIGLWPATMHWQGSEPLGGIYTIRCLVERDPEHMAELWQVRMAMNHHGRNHRVWQDWSGEWWFERGGQACRVFTESALAYLAGGE